MAPGKISCITTVFNEGPLLARSVSSMLAQSYEDWELILIDDGSDPPTRALLASFDDPRIQVVHQHNRGVSAARNRALELARGDYVCFLDADDTRPVWALESFARIIDRESPDVILCRGALSETTGRLGRFYDSAEFEKIEALIGEQKVVHGDPHWDAVARLAYWIEPASFNKVVRRDLLSAHRIGFLNGLIFEDIYTHINILGAARSLAFIHSASFTYHRHLVAPQITRNIGVHRLDAIATIRLTLDRFAQAPGYEDPAARAAVLGACLKLVAWCEGMVSHRDRHVFLTLAAANLQLVDPAYRAALEDHPADTAAMAKAKAYLADLLTRGGPPPAAAESERRHDA